MLDFVSSFLVEERVAAPDQSNRESTNAQVQQSGSELQEGTDLPQPSATLQVQYQTRRLSPGAKDALLFGHEPLALIEELKRLRMQASSRIQVALSFQSTEY